MVKDVDWECLFVSVGCLRVANLVLFADVAYYGFGFCTYDDVAFVDNGGVESGMELGVMWAL